MLKSEREPQKPQLTKLEFLEFIGTISGGSIVTGLGLIMREQTREEIKRYKETNNIPFPQIPIENPQLPKLILDGAVTGIGLALIGASITALLERRKKPVGLPR